MEINLEKIKKVYFVGIGGIGISAIARLMHINGKDVSGSDTSNSPIVNSLRELGIDIHIGHDAKNIKDDTDLIVYTIAVTEENPEMQAGRAKNIQMQSYPEMLAVISKNLETVAVSGTHGKTTTTAMLSKVLIDAKFDPTVIVGSMMKESKSNLVVGKGKYFVVEACEYKRSFLNLHPKILIITNIDVDHLDYYKDLADIQSAFRELALRVPQDGLLVCNPNDPNLAPVIQGLACTISDYTKYATPDLKLQIGGEHNKQNADCCLAVADFLKVEKSHALKSLESFTGTWRRFDLHGTTQNGTLVYDDYAHHPNAILVTLKGLRELYPNKKRVVFFMPHLFSRTKLLLDDFSKAFSDADEIFILPIYPAREIFDPSITSEMLVEKITQNGQDAKFVESLEEAQKIIENYDKNTVVMNIGAGDIYKLSEMVVGK